MLSYAGLHYEIVSILSDIILLFNPLLNNSHTQYSPQLIPGTIQ